ncbi:hypothetical protein CTA1_10057 [Colletotrichum tanaceti]|uniref:Uncharacterized protein n=1 Tax=Colletotrichum tanaceti TaxID=1306861 RepID=A0A4U6XVA6_9PEZI|nr:hypothetical protein CTA1_10057 [Colletotrichum tanaceti]
MIQWSQSTSVFESPPPSAERSGARERGIPGGGPVANARAELLSVHGDQEVVRDRREAPVSRTRAGDRARVDADEAVVRPRLPSLSLVPRVPPRRDAVDEVVLVARVGAAKVPGRQVARVRGRRGARVEALLAVLVRRVALKGHVARHVVVGEAAPLVAKGHDVRDDVVHGLAVRRRAAAAELDPVPVRLVLGPDAPAVEAVLEHDAVQDGDGGAELPRETCWSTSKQRGRGVGPMFKSAPAHAPASEPHFGLSVGKRGALIRYYLPKIDAVVRVVPEACAADDVAISRSLLQRDSIGAAPVLARVVVEVRVQEDDLGVGDVVLQVHAGLVVGVRRDALKVVVGRVLDVEAVGSPGERQVVEPPVVGAADVEDAPLRAREGALVLLDGRPKEVVAIQDDLLAVVGTHRVRGAGRAALAERDVLRWLVVAAADADRVAGAGGIDGVLDRRVGRADGAAPAARSVGGNEDISRQDCRSRGD